MHEHDETEALSREFLDHMRNPRNQGAFDDPSGTAEMTGQCGDSISVTILVEGDRIMGVRAEPRGCAFTVVCASAMSVLARGKALDEALGLDPEDIVTEVGGLPEDHLHCARLALNTLGEAITDHLERNGGSRPDGERAATG